MNKLFALPRLSIGLLLGFLADNFGAIKDIAGVVAPKPLLLAPKKPRSDWSEMKPNRAAIAAWNEEVEYIKATQRRWSAQRHAELAL